MAYELIRVPLDFRHPTTPDGRFQPGAHRRLLRRIPADDRAGFQVYENVSEGTPVSPVFTSPEEVVRWLTETQDISERAARNFAILRSAPAGIIRNGRMLEGIEALADMSEEEALDLAMKYPPDDDDAGGDAEWDGEEPDDAEPRDANREE